MNQSEPIPFAKLIDWIEGRLTQDEAQRIARQLETADSETRANVAWLRQFQRRRQGLTLESPPSQVRQALNKQFAAYAQERRPPTFFQRLVASLSYDSRVQTALAGIRSVMGAEDERELVFTAALADVTLNIQPHPQDGRVDLVGQVFPNEDETAVFTIQLLQNDAEIGLIASDDLGEFTFPALVPGAFSLIISSDRAEIVIPQIDLSA